MDDPRRRFLFSIHGDAGIGKTYLVRQLVRLARDRSYRTAYVDESMYDVVSVMEAMAAELEHQGAHCKGFRDKLETYRERRREVDSDPDAPDGLSSVLTRSAVRIGLRAAGDIPFVFLSKRFRNNHDVQLLRNPMGSLRAFGWTCRCRSSPRPRRVARSPSAV